MIPWKFQLRTVPSLLLYATLVFGASLLGYAVTSAWGRSTAPQPHQGILDLRSWNFSRDGSVRLGGTWSFLPGGWVTTPDPTQPWTVRAVPDTRLRQGTRFFEGTGSGTYRLQVWLPPDGVPLGLRYGSIWTTFEVAANGTTVVRGTATESGTVALPPAQGHLDLLVRVANQDYRWGGIVQPLVLGDPTTLKQQKRGNDLTALLLVGILVGVALYSIVLFVFRRRDLVNLSFAVFALMVALRALTSEDNLVTQLFAGLTVDSFLRLQYLALYGMLPAAGLFFWRLFPEEFGTIRLRVMLVPSVVFLGFVAVAPFGVLSWTPLPYSVVALGLVAYGYLNWCLRPAFRHRDGALVTLTAGTILLAAVVFAIYQLVGVRETEGSFSLMVIGFVLVQALVMARRFTGAFETAEGLAVDLKDANRRLAEEAREAEEARDELAKVLAEKEILLREVHHRVKNSLQIVLSIISLKARRTQDAGALGAYASVRDRIRAIASVHNRLFDFESEKRIDVPDYIRDLIVNFTQSYADAGAEIRFDPQAVAVPMDVCLDLGLILTELVLNAYTHAIMPQGGGTIAIAVGPGGPGLVLEVGDTGPGFPPGFDPEGGAHLGYKIILSLVHQRGGSLTVVPGSGATIRIELPTSASIVTKISS